MSAPSPVKALLVELWLLFSSWLTDNAGSLFSTGFRCKDSSLLFSLPFYICNKIELVNSCKGILVNENGYINAVYIAKEKKKFVLPRSISFRTIIMKGFEQNLGLDDLKETNKTTEMYLSL